MLRRFASPVLGLVALTLAGCSGPSPTGERVGQGTQPIIGGAPDSGDDGIVTVIWEGGNELTECSGTVIAADGSSIFILTAGHCCPPSNPPQVIWTGPNYETPTHAYAVTQYLKHPSYMIGGPANQLFDFCMVTAGIGTDAPPTIIPAMTTSTDNVGPSTDIYQVGYGQDQAGPEGTGNNSLKKKIGPIHYMDRSMYQALYDETAGGTCFGDSGGPDLAVGADGNQGVFGVHSFVSGDCNQESGSGIVSAVYTDFIATYLAGTPPVETCDSCAAAAQTGACSSDVTACDNNAECSALITCINGCNGSETCVQACTNQHPDGAADYNAIITCICGTACTSECASECGSSSNAGSTGSFSQFTSVSASGSGSAGGASPGAGGGNNAGGANGNTGGGKNGDAGNDGGCSAGGSNGSGHSAALLLAIAALAFGRRRGRAHLPKRSRN